MKKDGTDDEISAFCTRLVARYFFDQPVPDSIAAAALVNITEGVPTPSRYRHSAHTQATMYEFVKDKVPAENVADVVHNMGAAAGGLLAALRIMQAAGPDVHDTEGVRDALFKHPIIDVVPRTAVGTGTVNGLLSRPLVPNHTFILLKVSAAAAAVRDDNFLFGPGTPERQCPFKSIALGFTGDVAKRLQELRTAH
jgi:hypothetical protein